MQMNTAAIVILLGCSLVAAQPIEDPVSLTLPEKPRLEDYVGYLEANNPGLANAHYLWKAAVERIGPAKTLPDPNVGVGIFAREVETRVGPQEQAISISQMLPWKGKLRLKGEAASKLADARWAHYEVIRRQKIADFKRYFAELYYLGRAQATTGEHIQLLVDLEQVVSQRYRSGGSSYSNLLRIQLEIDKLEDRHKTLDDFAKPLVAALNELLGRRETVSIPFPEAIDAPADLVSQIERGSASELMASANPELKRLQTLIEQKRALLELETKNDLPDFKVGLDWIRTGDAIIPNTFESGKDPFVLRVGINLPIWRKKYRALEKAASYELQAVTREKVDKRHRLESELQRALFDYRDAIRKFDLYHDTIIPKAEESLTVLLKSFVTDQAAYLDVIDAEQTLLEFNLSRERASSDRIIALATIEKLISPVKP